MAPNTVTEQTVVLGWKPAIAHTWSQFTSFPLLRKPFSSPHFSYLWETGTLIKTPLKVTFLWKLTSYLCSRFFCSCYMCSVSFKDPHCNLHICYWSTCNPNLISYFKCLFHFIRQHVFQIHLRECIAQPATGTVSITCLLNKASILIKANSLTCSSQSSGKWIQYFS